MANSMTPYKGNGAMPYNSNMHVRWADNDGSSSLIASNDDEFYDRKQDTGIFSHRTDAVHGSLHGRTPPWQTRRRLVRAGPMGAAPPHTTRAATMMSSRGRDDVKDPKIHRRCQQPMAVDITAIADQDMNKSAAHNATAAATAPAHDSLSVLSPDKLIAVIFSRSNRKSKKDERNHYYPPLANTSNQLESRTIEPHPDSHDRNKRAADAALLFSPVTPSTPSIFEAAQQNSSCPSKFIEARGQRQAWQLFSPVSTASAQSFLSPSSAAFFSSGSDGCSPGFREPHAVFSAKDKNKRPQLSVPLCKHASAASYQPRTKCGCCGVSVQVRVAGTCACV